MMSRAEELSKQNGIFWTDQFRNKDELNGYHILGKEILSQLNKPIDLFCAGVGTAGMAMGVSKILKDANPKTKTVVLEPATAPLLTKGTKGAHKIEGIAVGIIPPLLEKSLYDEAWAIEESEARSMQRHS